MNYICEFCDANFWEEENLSSNSKRNPKFGFCCGNGRIKLRELTEPPEPFYSLFLRKHPKSTHFIKFIRAYNSNFALASLGKFFYVS